MTVACALCLPGTTMWVVQITTYFDVVCPIVTPSAIVLNQSFKTLLVTSECRTKHFLGDNASCHFQSVVTTAFSTPLHGA